MGDYSVNQSHKRTLLLFVLVVVFLFAPLGTHASDGFFSTLWCDVTAFFGFPCVEEVVPTIAPESTVHVEDVRGSDTAQEVTSVPTSGDVVTTGYSDAPPITNVYYTYQSTNTKLPLAELHTDTNIWTPFATFEKQVERIYDSLGNSFGDRFDEIADSFTTSLLTVTGNTTLDGALTLSSLGGGVLQTDGNGVVSTTTIGATSISDDSLDFAQLMDNLTLDVSTDIAVAGAHVFSITNTGTGNSFQVNDDASDTSPFVIDATGNVGIGSTTPSRLLTVQGAGYFGGLLTSASSSLGYASTTALTVNGASYFDSFSVNGTSTFASHLVLAGSGANIILGTNYLSGDGDDEGVYVDSNGRVGIGTTSPSSRLTILDTTATAQQRISYDAGNYAEFLVDALGDLTFLASGGDVWILDENMHVCAGGACPTPSTRISSAGNLLVENTVVASRFEEQCPAGYLWVQGSAKYGTLPGFCVMKYEAKNDGGNNAVSTATGNPWVSISQGSARTTCQAIGVGYHLISEPEWMTLAEQIANLPINDMDDDAGLQLGSGHNDNVPANALSATAGADPVVTSCTLMQTMENAGNAYSAGNCEIRGTGAGGSTDDDKGFYGTGAQWATTGYSAGANNKSQLRTHVLSNGEVIWDVAGNVWEWTDEIALQNDVPTDDTPLAEWLEYTAITTYGSYPHVRLPDDGWTAVNGVGRLYSQGIGASTRAFIRGGGWGSTSYAGVFTLYLNGAPAHTDTGLGFRCAR